MESLFISDLHLTPERPGTLTLFNRFLQEKAVSADQLYILGDLFDAWIGDDFDAPPIPDILSALSRLSSTGVELYFMRGNRDFLVGEGFAAATGCTLLNDPCTIEVTGSRALLMHGDLLCSDDLDYQAARKLVRNPAFIADLLAKPIPERIALAAEYRKRSGEATSMKAAEIMDVNQETVENYMLEAGVELLIHGHTHRPDHHRFQLGGQPARRIVLPEWHEDHAGFLRVLDAGLTTEPFD